MNDTANKAVKKPGDLEEGKKFLLLFRELDGILGKKTHAIASYKYNCNRPGGRTKLGPLPESTALPPTQEMNKIKSGSLAPTQANIDAIAEILGLEGWGEVIAKTKVQEFVDAGMEYIAAAERWKAEKTAIKPGGRVVSGMQAPDDHPWRIFGLALERLRGSRYYIGGQIKREDEVQPKEIEAYKGCYSGRANIRPGFLNMADLMGVSEGVRTAAAQKLSAYERGAEFISKEEFAAWLRALKVMPDTPERADVVALYKIAREAPPPVLVPVKVAVEAALPGADGDRNKKG